MRRVPHQDKLARTGIPNRISLREAWCQPSWWLSLCDLSVKSTPCRWCCWRKIGAEAFHGHQGTSLVVHRPTSYRFTSTYSTRANSDPVSQSPCDVRMVPFPQCTFSLSTTIGPFGEDWRDYHKTVLLQHHKVFPARDSATSLFHGLRTWS